MKYRFHFTDDKELSLIFREHKSFQKKIDANFNHKYLCRVAGLFSGSKRLDGMWQRFSSLFSSVALQNKSAKVKLGAKRAQKVRLWCLSPGKEKLDATLGPPNYPTFAISFILEAACRNVDKKVEMCRSEGASTCVCDGIAISFSFLSFIFSGTAPAQPCVRHVALRWIFDEIFNQISCPSFRFRSAADIVWNFKNLKSKVVKN